jgi:hypothetical protein
MTGVCEPLNTRNAGFVRVEHHDEMPCHVTSRTAAQPVPTQRIASPSAGRLLD